MPAIRFAAAPSGLLACGIVAVAFLAYWAFDHYPRFYLGDSTAYFTTGTAGWIPPDRSWAYGYASRWVVEAIGRISALVAVQCLLLAWAILATRRLIQPRDSWATLMFCALATLDPLLEAYTRFWLSDAAALAFFLVFLAMLNRFIQDRPAGFVAGMIGLTVMAFLSFSVRLAYVPVAFATAAGCLALSLRPGLQIARRRVLAACMAVVVAVGAVGVSNAVVSMPQFRGTFFLNRMSGLYELGVFTPALRHEDFTEAGVAMTQTAFDSMRLWDYDFRGAEVWSGNDMYLRAYLQKYTGIKDVYDRQFQALCHHIVMTGLFHHPQTFLVSYVHGLYLYLLPQNYVVHFPDEMGLNKDLPAWSVDFLHSFSRSPVTTATPRLQTPLIGLLGAVMPAYALVMMAGFCCAVLILFGAHRPRGQHVLALGLIFSLLATPIYSHGIKARYVLAVIILSYAVFCCMGRQENRSRAVAP